MALDDYTVEQVLAAFESVGSDKEGCIKRTKEAGKPTTPTVMATAKFMEDEQARICELAIHAARTMYRAGIPPEEAIAASGYGMVGWMSQIVFDVVRHLEASDELRRMADIPSDPEKEVNT